MILPNPPTDNLYKFIAITGIVLLLLSLVFPVMKEKELYTERNRYLMEKDILEVHGKLVDFDIDAYGKISQYLIEDTEKRLNDLKKHKENAFFGVVDENIIQLGKRIAKLHELLDKKEENLKRGIELKYKIELINYLSNRLQTLRIISYVGIGLGALLAGLGFLLWYRKLQLFQDKIIRKDYEK